MNKTNDYIGQTFGRWTIIGPSYLGGNQRKALARCECGKERDIYMHSVKRGKSLSCGCLRADNNRRHGDHRSRLYSTWNHMRSRCHNPDNRQFPGWGGRGITVCDDWRNDYLAFREWSLANGYADNLEIDRRDNNAGYSPENCRWVDGQTNRQNKRDVKLNPSKLALILVLTEAGKTQRWIGEKLGTGHGAVGAVLRGNSWQNVIGGLSPRPLITSRQLF